MEFHGNKAYLTEAEVRATGLASPFDITSQNLGELNDSIQRGRARIDEFTADHDTLPHDVRVRINVALLRLEERSVAYNRIASYACRQFGREVETITTPADIPGFIK